MKRWPFRLFCWWVRCTVCALALFIIIVPVAVLAACGAVGQCVCQWFEDMRAELEWAMRDAGENGGPAK